jgi:hypothetical protein
MHVPIRDKLIHEARVPPLDIRNSANLEIHHGNIEFPASLGDHPDLRLEQSQGGHEVEPIVKPGVAERYAI